VFIDKKGTWTMIGKERTKGIMEAALLFLGACSMVAGVYGLVMVVKMGLLPSSQTMGHSREYEEGWRLFWAAWRPG